MCYTIAENVDGYLIDCWVNYIHQDSWLQYGGPEPLPTAPGQSVSDGGVCGLLCPGRQNRRGYVCYTIAENVDGYLIDCWVNYIHQDSWLQ